MKEKQINAEVIDLRSLRPLDIKTVIDSVKKTNRLVCLEEGWVSSGIGAEVTSAILEQAFFYLDAPPKRVTAEDVPLPYSSNLEKYSLPNKDTVVEKCLSLFNLNVVNN